MKKICAGILAAVVVLFCFTGCGKSEKDLYTMSVYFEDNGIPVKYECTPSGSKKVDAMSFYYENELVEVFLEDSEDDIKNKDYTNYPEKVTLNGRFRLETNNEKVIEVFKSFDPK